METNQQRFVKEYTEKKLEDGKGLVEKDVLQMLEQMLFKISGVLQYKRNTEKLSKESNLFYIDMLALLAKPCIVMAQKVIKVGKATKPKGYC